MRYANFKYEVSENLGDEIQSLAISQFITQVDTWVNRDTLRQLKLPEKHLLIMNGWYSSFPETCFPPSDDIVPLFWGFHLSNWHEGKVIEYFTQPECIDYFKRHEPIGCRDRGTRDILRSKGVDAFYSKCLTLTFPKRNAPLKGEKVFLVDLPGLPIPQFFAGKVVNITHHVSDDLDAREKRRQAQALLNAYRHEANLIITRRLHAALPAIAMGIPVVFIGNPKDYRLSILLDLNVPIYPAHNYGNIMNDINWQPPPIPIETQKKKIIRAIQARIQELYKRHFQ